MDIISTEELKRIADYGKLMDESDVGSALDYNEFLAVHKQAIDSLKGPGPLDAKLYLAFQDVCSSWLKDHSPPIVRVGKGSSRVAFRCGDGTCLKVAYNTKGIGQNRQEIQNFASTQKNDLYPCFAKLYKYDKQQYASLLTECCALIEDPQDFAKFFEGISVGTIVKCLDDVLVGQDGHCKFKTLKQLEQIAQNENLWTDFDYPEMKTIIGYVLRSNAPQWKIIRSLVEFTIKTDAQKLLLSDLDYVENWGLGIRFGEIVPIILDAGLSREVNDVLY